jgi:phage tail-like protein
VQTSGQVPLAVDVPPDTASGSARGMVPGLPSPVPLLQRLPGVLQDDDFTRRFVAAFDDAYAPILTTLDSLACYFDPRLAPSDFVDYLAGWVGVELDDSWTLEQRRRIVAGAALVHRRRGTRQGIEDALALGLSARVTVTDSGGCTWSLSPGGALPGTSPARVDVRVEVADPDAVDRRRVESLIESTKPAHVAHSVTVARGGVSGLSGVKADPPPPPPPPPGPSQGDAP